MSWRVFYSYSHKDSVFRDKLSTTLAPLKHNKKIVEWHDRKIEPGTDWNKEISNQLDSAQLILLLISPDFLASEYCFGVEVEQAMARFKRGEAKIVPVLLRPCLWDSSPFSELQIVPRGATPISKWSSEDDAFLDVAKEISALVSQPPPAPPEPSAEGHAVRRFDASLDLVRNQVRNYARLYERTRQRMKPSDERTYRMEQVFANMLMMASASYPLLDELAGSPSPGERLAAVAILQVFASEDYLPFLVKLVSAEKPFVSYHAIKALRFAVGSLDPRFYPQLTEALQQAKVALASARAGFDTDRHTMLAGAEEDMRANIASLSVKSVKYD